LFSAAAAAAAVAKEASRVQSLTTDASWRRSLVGNLMIIARGTKQRLADLPLFVV